MAARTERVRSDLGAAEQAKADADTLLADYRAQLANTRNEANQMLEEARRSADALRADLQARAQSAIAELRARAAADVEAAKISAIADLRAEVASLAIGAAETIVQKNLDRETQVQLVENYINQVGSRQ
jgi:F-type H+-transporting ATPase subunit b